MSHAISVPEEAREQLNATVAALRRPSTYPGTEAPDEALETHMAWVFLTASHAYKLKKPIQARLIDHRTVEARRRACHTEVELNRRLAAPVYLGVVPLADTEDGLRLEGDGSPVDWLVKMRRLPRAQMLDAQIEEDRVSRASIDRLGATLVAFYRTADPVRWTDDEYRGQPGLETLFPKTAALRPRPGARPRRCPRTGPVAHRARAASQRPRGPRGGCPRRLAAGARLPHRSSAGHRLPRIQPLPPPARPPL